MSLTHVDPHVSEIVMVWIQSGDLLMVWIQISLLLITPYLIQRSIDIKKLEDVIARLHARFVCILFDAYIHILYFKFHFINHNLPCITMLCHVQVIAIIAFILGPYGSRGGGMAGWY
jgi:multisubunit Na+/H+ antiporter MnhG subunit